MHEFTYIIAYQEMVTWYQEQVQQLQDSIDISKFNKGIPFLQVFHHRHKHSHYKKW